MKIRSIMRNVVPTCRPFDPLLEAAREMLRHEVGCLPVLAADESGRVVGMLSDRDVSMAVARDPRALAELQVRSAMAPGEPTCSPEDPVSEALDRMRSAGVNRVLVVDERGRLVGLLSLDDVARAVSSGKKAVPCEEICRTIAESAHPHPGAEHRDAGAGDSAPSQDEPRPRDAGG